MLIPSLILSWAAITQQPKIEFKSDNPVYSDGTRASGAIPNEFHKQNEGGSDGQGLCVIASIVMVGRTLGLDAEVEKLWREAKKRPGGYFPEKVDRLIEESGVDITYAHYLGSDVRVLEELDRRGIPYGVTMDTGEIYNFQPISHMVAGQHFDGSIASYVDNNEPGKHVFVSRKEWVRRITLNNGSFWVLAIAGSKKSIAKDDGFLIVLVLAVCVVWLEVSKNGRFLDQD